MNGYVSTPGMQPLNTEYPPPMDIYRVAPMAPITATLGGDDQTFPANVSPFGLVFSAFASGGLSYLGLRKILDYDAADSKKYALYVAVGSVGINLLRKFVTGNPLATRDAVATPEGTSGCGCG